MELSIKQKNVFTEAYTILEYLEEREFNKIPKEVLAAIEENRNLDYEYEMNDELDLSKQEMMPETKALLFNIFKDYLADSDQKQKIVNYEEKARAKEEEAKRQKYNPEGIFSGDKNEKNVENNEFKNGENSLVELKEPNFIKKIILKIKSIFSN